MQELRELFLTKVLELREAGEDFDAGRILFMEYMLEVKEIGRELNEILDKWEAMNRRTYERVS